MAKKEVKEKISKVKISKDAEKLNRILVENFVNLQKAMTNITVKFDKLSDQISSLLQLFEISAKSFAEKLSTGAPQIEKDREFLDKLNKLLDQNKVIAKGLTLMESKIKERLYGEPAAPVRRQFLPPHPPASPYRYTPSTLEKEKKTKELE